MSQSHPKVGPGYMYVTKASAPTKRRAGCQIGGFSSALLVCSSLPGSHGMIQTATVDDVLYRWRAFSPWDPFMCFRGEMEFFVALEAFLAGPRQL